MILSRVFMIMLAITYSSASVKLSKLQMARRSSSEANYPQSMKESATSSSGRVSGEKSVAATYRDDVYPRRIQINRHGDKGEAVSTARTREAIQRCIERSEKDIARLFPEPDICKMMMKEFHQYFGQARRYGMHTVKALTLGTNEAVATEITLTEEQRAERKKDETKRYVVRRRLKTHPNDPVMLARAKELGMDLNNLIRKKKKADYVHRFLEIHHPDMIPFHLAMAKDPQLVVKIHHLGFPYLAKKRVQSAGGGKQI